MSQNFNRETNSYLVKKIVGNMSKIRKDINDYAELCSELKLLYTAITRPRKTLIIYDEDSSSRKTIEHLWAKLDIVELISQQIINDSSKSKGVEKEEVAVFKKIVNSTSHADWKKQGIKMYSRGYFDQAMKCFERSESKDLYKKAQANKYANEATKKLIELESEKNNIKQGVHFYKNMTTS